MSECCESELEFMRIGLETEKCVFVKPRQALRSGRTDGRHAAIMTKSFSMLFHRPIWSALVNSSVMVGLPRRDALDVTLTTAKANALDIVSRCTELSLFR